MREFDLDLLIGKEVAVNCKTELEEIEFLTYLQKIGIKWCNDCAIFENKQYRFKQYRQNTCFAFYDSKSLVYSGLNFYIGEGYKILSLDNLVIKPKNNFKEYGFEADFEGKILSDIEDYYIGYYVEKYPCITEKQKIPTFWNKNTGNCYKGAGISNSKFTLKPIKKEWYENPDNFPAVTIDIETKKPHIVYAYKDRRFQTEKFTVNFDKYRLATKEEVLSLLVKE